MRVESVTDRRLPLSLSLTHTRQQQNNHAPSTRKGCRAALDARVAVVGSRLGRYGLRPGCAAERALRVRREFDGEVAFDANRVGAWPAPKG